MKKKSKTDDSLRLHVTEELHIQNEKKEKACNLIVYNVPESDSKVSKAQAELEDVQNVKNVFNFVCPSVDYSGLSSKTVTRCGTRIEPTPDFPTLNLDLSKLYCKIHLMSFILERMQGG